MELGKEVQNQVWSQVGNQVQDQVRNTVRDFYMPIINGRNFQNNFVSFLDLCRFI